MAAVLITGCSSGFGLEAALAFARNGDVVCASMRNLDKAEPLRKRAADEGLDAPQGRGATRLQASGHRLAPSYPRPRYDLARAEPAKGLRDFVETISRPGVADQVGAVPCKRRRRLQPDVLGGTGDHDVPATEVNGTSPLTWTVTARRVRPTLCGWIEQRLRLVHVLVLDEVPDPAAGVNVV
jgi:NAD(P)-dependent dehydrogenase (short-subunit alcohol dehydrogenase family)